MKPSRFYFMGFISNPPHTNSKIFRIDHDYSEYKAHFNVLDLHYAGTDVVCTMSAMHSRRDVIPMRWVYETN